ncbi:DUF3561 family protein [Sodalis sp. RH21]|uniref:DUF3561 family protein n=1 Tax=unclassified Sodalis (in: enterobacteria) TaxID=2636512 RepID=UPI0039B5B183
MPVKLTKAPGVERGAEEPAYGFWGAMAGFIFYWLAFAVPILLYGANALFFLLYTWPFFLALIPVSVLIGLIFSVLLAGRLLLMILCIGVSVFCLFWLVFAQLTGW